MLQDLLKGIKSFVFPNNCLICRLGPLEEQDVICPSCLSRLPAIKALTPTSLGCIDQTYSAYRYEEPLIELIHRFKYYQTTKLARLFIQLSIEAIKHWQLPTTSIDMIIPIPLHPSKERERGYNQAKLLAAGIAQHFKLTLYDNVLLRQRATDTQTHLSLKERWTNQEGTFKITEPALIANKHILIVDDLTTSGATAQTAAYALKKHGALRVSLFTLAKA